MGKVIAVLPMLQIQFPFWPPLLTNENCLNRQHRFRLERLPNLVTLNRSIEAMKKLNESPISAFFNLNENIDLNEIQQKAQEKLHQFDERLDFSNVRLNTSQRQAIQRALENRFTLIQGPPGTGKTETAAWIIDFWLKNFPNSTQPVLVCAETHQAVDNLTRRLLKFDRYRIVRYAESRAVSSDLQVL